MRKDLQLVTIGGHADIADRHPEVRRLEKC
jgi:hypothetical protein